MRQDKKTHLALNIFNPNLSFSRNIFNWLNLGDFDASYLERHLLPLSCPIHLVHRNQVSFFAVFTSNCWMDPPASGIRPSRRTTSLTLRCKSSAISCKPGVCEPQDGTRRCAPGRQNCAVTDAHIWARRPTL